MRLFIRLLFKFVIAGGIVGSSSLLFAFAPSSMLLQANLDSGDTMTADGENVLAEDISNMSGEQMLEESQQQVRELKDQLEQAEKLLEEAKKERDILKINSLTEKIAPLKGFVNVAEQGYIDLKNALDGGDINAARHHFTMIMVAAARADELFEEVQVASGQIVRYADGTQVDLTVDQEVAAESREIIADDPQNILALDTDTGSSNEFMSSDETGDDSTTTELPPPPLSPYQ